MRGACIDGADRRLKGVAVAKITVLLFLHYVEIEEAIRGCLTGVVANSQAL